MSHYLPHKTLDTLQKKIVLISLSASISVHFLVGFFLDFGASSLAFTQTHAVTKIVFLSSAQNDVLSPATIDVPIAFNTEHTIPLTPVIPIIDSPSVYPLPEFGIKTFDEPHITSSQISGQVDAIPLQPATLLLNTQPNESNKQLPLQNAATVQISTTDSDTTQNEILQLASAKNVPMVSIVEPIALKQTRDQSAKEASMISFRDIANKPIKITTPEALEITPESSKSTDLLLGINEKFKQKITNKLGVSLSRIKPNLVAKNIQGHVYFQFTLDRNGRLIDSRILRNRGDKRLNKIILDMLKNSSPFAKLPDQYRGESLKFSYPIDIQIR